MSFPLPLGLPSFFEEVTVWRSITVSSDLGSARLRVMPQQSGDPIGTVP